MTFVPYAARRVAYSGVIEHRGYRLKCYDIIAGPGHLASNRFAPGLAALLEHLPQPAVAPGRAGVGFVIRHQGATADYAVLAWWSLENELPLRVAVRDQLGWRRANGDESICVWDLEVIQHERQAYISTLLSGRPVNEAADDYLACVFARRS